MTISYIINSSEFQYSRIMDFRSEILCIGLVRRITVRWILTLMLLVANLIKTELCEKTLANGYSSESAP